VLPELTNRERQILRLMAEGRRNPEIADGLFLSPLTVKTHVNHIFSKLGVQNRVEAILAFKEATGQSSDRP
jgi:DNA-binding CsgD family transcriptional regulator